MEISEIKVEDLDAVKTLQPEGWSDIMVYQKFYLESPVCKSYKFMVENRIAGIGALILHKNSAWLGHIIVHPDFRNKGIGGVITNHLIDSLKSTSCKSILLIATQLGEPVYKKAGFRKDGEYLFYKNEDYKIIPEENKLIRNVVKSDFEKILILDQRISGEDRKLLFEPHLAKAKIFANGSEILGCYLPSLGEGLVIATDKNAGIELLKLKLAIRPFAVLPKENKIGNDFLVENYFQHFQTGIRMSLGPSIDFKGEMLYGRIGGNLG